LLRLHTFPLDHGGQGTVPCLVCHAETYVQYTCYGCHDHQEEAIRASHLEEGISEAELPACFECHEEGT
jgi:hypothetical protein